MKNGHRIIANSIEVKGVPGEVKILPVGNVTSLKGDFIVDAESFKQMKDTFEKRGLDVVVDYEHQTLENVEAPAGGWIKDIKMEDGAIIAKVEWTKKAQEYLENKEYRYLSPVVLTRKSDSRAVVLHSVALTNTPAINNMYPIINKDISEEVDLEEYKNEGGNEMDSKKIAALLGLQEDATEEQIVEALKEIINKKAEGTGEEIVANKTVLGLLGLDETSKTEDVTSSIMALKNPAGFVPASEFDKLKERLDKKDGEELVTRAMKAGKITATQKEWAIEYALKDPAGFEKFIEKAPEVVPMGEISFGGKTTQKKDDETTIRVCKMLGVNSEDIEKYGKEVK
ncbi:MAG: hypothetical protein COA82_06665 [Alkaliphilus sp.]|nr:MAG: hypothetical protein COA82_06665 [Alkaliphilus sp.]